MSKRYLIFVLLILVVFSPAFANNEDTPETDLPKVYIDCADCDIDFIKTEIPFVNYVIDRTVADIHVLVTTRITAGGGTEHMIEFIGQHDYEGMNDTLTYISQVSDSDDTIRRGIVQKLKLGFVRYVAKTPIADDLCISTVKKELPTVVKDKWHNWVFTIDLSSYLDGEQSTLLSSIYTILSATRVTDDWKLSSGVYYDYDYNSFQVDDTTKISSTSKSYGSDDMIVKSINDHWSIGGGYNIYKSTYRNKDIAFFLWPAVEYNIFPYRQSTQRELKLMYKAGYVYNNYSEITIYNKTEEKLFHESLSLTLNIIQRWGSISSTLSGSNYFHDFTKNRLTLYSQLSLPLVRGLSFTLYGYASWIHDQISLPKRDLTPEEILLRKKQLSTQYDYYLSIGLSYSFGSLYSNIVNPRF